MASSSSSHQQNQEFDAFSGKRRMVCESSKLFDVFINHRGPDVKDNLAIELYNSLERLGIRAFLDSQEKELGNSFPSTIETAICSASVHVAIFSKGYAQSAWCLAELVLMLQTQAKIIPLFYQVKPSDLRHIEKGVYADAFLKYQEKSRYLEKLNGWKEALQSISFIAGEEFNSFSDWDRQKIVAAVQKEVQRKARLHVAQYPVGLNNLVKDFERRCLKELVQDFENQRRLKKEKDRAKIVGIFGMGGVGKTTLAKELFNQKSSEHFRASFLFDVREASTRGELPVLQLKLLKDLFDPDHLDFTSIEEGTSYLKDNLRRSTDHLDFLIVVDDIDHVEQLNALRIMDILNKFGNSLVIVTTRDVGVLITAGITDGYRLKGMDRNYGRELFCWHAFDQPNPSSGYEELVDSFVDVCGGLPLCLQVLGRHVHGRSQDYWRSELIEVGKMLPRDVKQRLRISFDALGSEEKQVFMDIACFFGGKLQGIAKKVWEGSGWNAQHALKRLREKCLVEERGLRMHDHLRDLGREMALEFGTPRRLWHPRDLKYLESKGFRYIVTKTNVRCFHSIFDKTMSCRVTFFLGQSNICVETSPSLLYLQLKGNSTKQPVKSIPSWIPLQSLQCLKIKRGQLKTLWKNRIQAPSQLKELHISETSLKKFPKFSGISENLEKVFLDARKLPIQGLSLLESLSMDLCGLYLSSSTLTGEQASTNRRERPTCESLVIYNFKFSGEVAWNNGRMSSSVKAPMSGLEKLEISGEELVSKILFSGIHYSSLQSIKLHDMENLKEVDLIRVNTLNCLDITNCKNLKILKSESGILNLPKLVLLNISKCPKLKELNLGHLSCLERITIVDCKDLKSVSGISDLRNLVELNVNGSSDYLKYMSGVSGSRNVAQLNISKCPELRLANLNCAHLSCLEKIVIENCNHLRSVSGISNLAKLVLLNISQCAELEELSLGHLSSLERITIVDCKHLKSVSGIPGHRNLVELNVNDYKELVASDYLKSVSGVSGSRMLAQLSISECPELEEITLAHLGYLEKITIKNCCHLKSVRGISNLAKLVELEISDCGKLVFKCLCLSGMKCLESITFDRNVKVKYFKLDGCQILKTIKFGCEELVELSIRGSPELNKLPRFRDLSCVERIIIDGCGKLKYLQVYGCPNLKSVSGNLGVTRLSISDCPELEELPSFSRLSCFEQILIDSCKKLQNITLPTTFISLSIRNCRYLQRVAGTGDLTKLTKLYINKCPELEELPSLSRQSCLEQIVIDSCEKVENIAGIEELHALKSMQLFYCSNAAIQNCIPKLKSVPMSTCLIGRAVDGARSTLNEYLFYDADIDAASVTEIGVENSGRVSEVTDIVTEISAENSNELKKWRVSAGTVIVCSVVMVDSSTPVEDINKSLSHGFYYDSRLEVREGEWIITMVAAPYGYYYDYYMKIEDVLRRFGVMKKGFRIEVKKDEEWKSVRLLSKIVDRLYNL